MIEKLLMKLRARDDVSAEEEAILREAVAETRTYPAKATIVPAGQVLTFSTLLVRGLMCRFKDLSDGKRQMTEIHVEGDFADLHSFTLKRLEHSVMALTPCEIAVVPHERLQRITENHPHLTRLLWFSTNLDAAIHREWVLSLGRRSALARTAHLFCELHVRLGLVGLTEGLSYDFDVTQADLAECLGLTPVHVNRTLKELREQGLVEFRNSRVKIGSLEGLRDVAEFDGEYLHLEKLPR